MILSYMLISFCSYNLMDSPMLKLEIENENYKCY